MFVTLWTITCPAPLSMRFSRQEYWSELLCPPPGDLPDPGIEPTSPSLRTDSLPLEPPGKPLIIAVFHKFLAKMISLIPVPDCQTQVPFFSSQRNNLTLPTCEWLQERRNEHIPSTRWPFLEMFCKTDGPFTLLPQHPPTLF